MSDEARKILDEAMAKANRAMASLHATMDQIEKARAALESVPEREAKWLAYRDAVVDLLARCDGLAMPNGQLNRLMGTVRAADPLADRPKEKALISCVSCAAIEHLAHDRTPQCPPGPEPVTPDPKLAEDVKVFITEYEKPGVLGALSRRVLAAMARRVFAAELGE